MKKFLCGLLAAVATLSLVACVPSNMEKAEKRMKSVRFQEENVRPFILQQTA